ncbi:MAG: hypothetical protein JF564_04220 [Sphingomonas sp.]|nr:hypothetical protein [Sphingomonas sp.]
MNIPSVRQWGYYRLHTIRSAVDAHADTGALRWTGTVALLVVVAAIGVVATIWG